MTDDVRVDVAIVGNGVVGLSIALELARRGPGVRVAVIGPPGRAGAASAAAGAMLNCFGEVTGRTTAHEAGLAKLRLCREALDAWPGWLEDLAEEAAEPGLPGYFRPGTFVVLNTRSGRLDEDNFHATRAELAGAGEPYEEVEPRDIVGLDPVPGARPLRAMFLRREGAVDARRVLAALGRAAGRYGVLGVPVEAESLLVTEDRVTGVRLAGGGVVSAGAVVVAAGAFSGRFLGVLPPGAVPPLLSGVGISVETRRVRPPGFEHVVRTPNRSGSCGLHVVPLGDGLEYVGATNIVSRSPVHEPGLGMTQFLLQCAREQLDHRLFHSLAGRWMVGNRPVALDGFPLFGGTSLGGLSLAAGTYRDGFHCSPVLAGRVAEQVLSASAVVEGLELFRPERAPIETMSVEESVAEFAYHGVCGAFEGGLELPSWIDPQALEPVYRQAAEVLYGRMEVPVALPPEMVMHLSLNAASQDDVESVAGYLKSAAAYHAGSSGPERR